MKTREQFIASMCFSWRHDYGLSKSYKDTLSSGLTEDERKYIWIKMAQIFDNDIAPYMELKPEYKLGHDCGND